MNEEKSEILIKWLKDEVKEVKEAINFMRNESLPHVHARIDNILKELGNLTKQNHKISFEKYVYIIIIMLLLILSTMLEIKNFPLESLLK